MNMDVTPDNNAESDSKTKTEDVTPEPQSFKNTFIIGLAALIFGSIGTLGIQHFYPPKPTQSSVVKEPDHHWQEIQNQLQALNQSQQKITEQVLTQQHQIQALKQSTIHPVQPEVTQQALYYLDLAQMNAQWSHNINGSVSLLLAADQILANSAHPNVSNIRLAIHEDLQALEQIPTIDTLGLLTQLSTLEQKISSISLPANTIAPKPVSTEKTTTWRDNLQDNMQQLRGLISIHYQDSSWLEPFNPSYLALLRENIRMSIQQAKLAVVEQHQDLYDVALKSVDTSLYAGFNANTPSTQALLEEVHRLQKAKVAYTLPKLHSYPTLFTQYPSENTSSPAGDAS